MKRTTIRTISMLLTVIAVLCLFASCSSKSEDHFANNLAPAPEANGGELGFGETEKGELPAEPSERKIIKTYNLVAQTKEFDKAIGELETLAAECGGYVESSSIFNKSLEYSDNYSRRASYTFRIPAEQADAFVSSTGTLLHLTSNTSKVEDVSETYYTLEAMLEELYAERDSLLKMMESLDSKSDYNFWLTLQQRLSEVKQKIAVYQAQLNNYDSRVAYSTVTLELREVLTYSSQAQSNSFGARMGAAFKESWSNFWLGCQEFAIFLVRALPTLLVLCAVGTGIFLLIRGLIRRGRKKRAARAATGQNAPSDA